MPDKALESDLPTVRVTLTDATVEHGRLLVISGSHRHRGVTPIRHVIDAPGESNTIPASELAPGSRVPLPVRRGGLVLFDRLTRHASLPNRSDGIRMCVDQRYQPAGRPILTLSRGAGPHHFVARSRASPDSVLQDAQAWAGLWKAAARATICSCVSDGRNNTLARDGERPSTS